MNGLHDGNRRSGDFGTQCETEEGLLVSQVYDRSCREAASKQCRGTYSWWRNDMEACMLESFAYVADSLRVHATSLEVAMELGKRLAGFASYSADLLPVLIA